MFTRLKFTAIFLVGFVIVSSPQIASAKIDKAKFVSQICFRIQAVAEAQNVPEAFLARLIWKESRFDPNAVSHKGAQGIAQFIPSTARLVGLKDPFEPHSAIAASAVYLNDLKAKFGNWGLAAAGYNAGPGRVSAWLSGNSGLPFETQDFVASITGHSAEQWKKEDFKGPEFKLSEKEDFQTACNKFPVRHTLFRTAALVEQPKPWGVHLGAHFNRSRALSIYKRLQNRYPSILKSRKPSLVRKVNRSFGTRPRYNVQIGADSRAEGNKLCNQLKRVGGVCLVLRN